MKITRKSKNIIITVLIIILLVVSIVLMILNGYIIPTKIETEKYEVKGVDVSEYQGEVDWEKIKGYGISFAFVKATEGSKYKDKYFKSNFEKLKTMDMLVGVYHFFSFKSSGENQALNYIETVGNIQNDDTIFLPIIDVEYYGNYKKENPDKEKVIEELQKMLDKLESTYRVKPMIYTTMEFYKSYIDGNFSDYDIWIRNVITKPKLKNRDWKFWQYSGRGRLDGYSGEEKFIDLNVFNGTKEEFDKYLENKKQEKKDNFSKEEQEKVKREENTITSIYGALIKNIEGNNYTLETDKKEILKVTIDNNSNIETLNKRTKEKFDIKNVKINDKLDINKVYIRKGEIVFTEESKIYVIRNITGEELKKELLKGEIDFDLEDITKKGGNYILKGQMIDLNYSTDYNEAEKFEIEVIVNNNTKIFGEGITGGMEEKLKSLNNILYITFDKNELKKGKLVAINIEMMGCQNIKLIKMCKKTIENRKLCVKTIKNTRKIV